MIGARMLEAPKGYRSRCSIARTLDLLGDRWTLLIVRELGTGPKRYTDLADALPGIGTSLLATRVRQLETDGVIQRRLAAKRREEKRALARQRGAFAIALQNMSNGLVMVDEQNVIIAINDRVFELFGISSEGIGNDTPLRVLMERIGAGQGWSAPVMGAKFAQYLEALAEEGATSREEELADGRILFVSCRRVPSGGAVITFDDVSELWAAQAEIAQLAHYDPLTGLLNRRSFREHVQSREEGEEIAVLLLDLDHFKIVNDTMGHPAGDSLLKQVAGRLEEVLRRRGLVFRLGGDEMIVLLEGWSADAAAFVGDEIVERLGTSSICMKAPGANRKQEYSSELAPAVTGIISECTTIIPA